MSFITFYKRNLKIVIVIFLANFFISNIFGQDSTGIITLCGVDSTLILSNAPNIDSTSFHECGFVRKGAPFFDIGSYSINNKPVYFKVKRKDKPDLFDGNGKFDDFVYFNCDDIDVDITIILRVYDAKPDSGHVSDSYLPNQPNSHFKDCEVVVNIYDNTSPTIRCPSDISINCSKYNFENPLKNKDTSYFNKYFGIVNTQDCQKINPSNTFNYFNQQNAQATAPNGVAFDICYVKVEQSINYSFSCGEGVVYRNFVAIDSAGNKSSTCVQNIYIHNDQPIIVNPNVYRDAGASLTKPCDGLLRKKVGAYENFDTDPYFSIDSVLSIIWPDKIVDIVNCVFADSIGTGCDSTGRDTGKPIILGNDFCNPVFMTYKDEYFPIEPGFCRKILRTWTVHDTCRLVDTSWSYFQVINIRDKIAPNFTMGCKNDTVCSYINDCFPTHITLCSEAEDNCTIKSKLKYSYIVNLYNNDTYDQSGKGNCASIINSNLYNENHSIIWAVEDDCGNINTCKMIFRVKECTKPIAYGKSVSLNLSSSNCTAVLEAKMVNQNSTDNCTPINELKYKIVKEKDYKPNYTTEEIINLSDTIVYRDTNVGANFVYLIAVDNNNNWGSFKSIVIVNNTFGCFTPDSSTSYITTKSDLGELIDSVDIFKNDSLWFSRSSGIRPFKILDSLQHKITILGNSNARNGVSTADLVAINKHILLVDTLETPYKRIAADINNDKKIATSDMVELRKIILFIQDKFSNNKSWKFVDKLYPFLTNYPEKESYQEFIFFNKNKLKYDFVGIKIGDVNNSAKLNTFSDHAVDRASMNILIQDKKFSLNEIFEIEFDINKIGNPIDGLQFALKFDDKSLELVNMNVQSDCYNPELAKDGILLCSILKEDLSNSTIKIKFKSKQQGWLSDFLKQDYEWISNELYFGNGNIHPLVFDITNRIGEDELYQNEPNPFSDQTKIKFDLSVSSEAILTIFDMNGRILNKIAGYYPKGKNEIVLQNNDLNASGLLFYQLKTPNYEATKKMIVIH